MWAPFPFTVDAKNQLTSSPGGSPSYDANGNLTALHDGTFDTAEYDDENRLISMQVSNSWRTDFAYDGLGRLRQRNESNWGGAGWLPNYLVNYIYDGWRVIQERNSTNTPTFSYTRGNDLSGSMEGAGGIGGLLARSANYSSGNWLVHHYYFADGNGNVTTILSSFPRVVASYRYDPFGNTISSSGTLASTNVYRFSSKEIHVNSGMYYYGYRFYDPNLQRWINRDPIEEEGGKNLYCFLGSNPIERIDALGLESAQIVVTTVIRPPDAQAGVKTIHSVAIDDYGNLSKPITFTGSTKVAGYPFTGTSKFRQWASGSHPDFTITMIGNSHSAALPAFMDIDYNFDVALDFCSHRGHLTGKNDSYPSYVVRVNGQTVYDFQQQSIVGLLGSGDIAVDTEFSW